MSNVLLVPLIAAAGVLCGACFGGLAVRCLGPRHPPGRHRAPDGDVEGR